MKKEFLKNIILFFSAVISSYLFYYYVSMDLINQYYSLTEDRGLVLYGCHIIFFYLLLKLIFSVKITKLDKLLSVITYICILYMALFDRFDLGQRVINLNPLDGLISQGIMQMILNIIVFFPFYTIQNWLGHFTRKQYYIVFFICVIAFEFIQYLTMRGIADINDIILNAIGYMCGIKLHYYFFRNKIL